MSDQTTARRMPVLCAMVLAAAALISVGALLPRLLEQRTPSAITTDPIEEWPVIRASPRATTPFRSARVARTDSVERPIAVPARPSSAAASQSRSTAVPPRDSSRSPALTAIRYAPAEEVTIPLQEWRTITTRYGVFSVKILDHGPVTFTVWLNGESRGRRLDKIKGFETTGTNITPIHRLSGADVYYIDRISVSVGHCVLKIVPTI